MWEKSYFCGDEDVLMNTAPTYLLERLRDEMTAGIKGGIYHRLQIDLTYNSNHIEGSRLTHEQTRYIYETSIIAPSEGPVHVDDVIETLNHFRCIDLVIRRAGEQLTDHFVKALHGQLKNGTHDSTLSWFKVGDYKALPNEVGGEETTPPQEVADAMNSLIEGYTGIKNPGFDDLLDFHYRFERIHPFQDGNGRVGRLILLHQCLSHGIVPFVITDQLKWFYYRGLQQWPQVKGYLRDTCLTAQDSFKLLLEYFKIPY